MTAQQPSEAYLQEAERRARRSLDDRAHRIRDAVALTKREITEDIASGRFAAEDIACFSDLHNYVDANTYGGLCDEDGPWHDLDSEATLRDGNSVQDIVDQWIRAGGITTTQED